ncbi:MAG: hypothetical protein K2P78_02640 [Gemmataceae bacterium]|nr:hypothetical protein [Gemmataceae bacterium]
MTTTTPQPTLAVITVILPGPDRKRTGSLYHYRVTYRSPDPSEPGCAMAWEVAGGRDTYQIFLERTAAGEKHWHCTCPDAVYRGEDHPEHSCKHVQGLAELLDAVRAAA